MAKRSRTTIPSSVESVVENYLQEMNDDTLDKELVGLYTNREQSTKRLQSVFSAHLKLTGQTSGKLYEWAKAGDIVDVFVEDVDGLLQKRIGNSSCCGGSQGGNLLLKIVD